MAADAEEIPQDLKTRYSDFRLLGSGAMGCVYKATDNDLLIDVAIKILLANRGASSDAAIRFQREAKAASKLTHRNLVTIMDFGIASGDQLYLVMEFAKGETLESFIGDQSISLNNGVRVISQICDGMSHAHSLGVVHRDLKPANIIVDGENLNDASIKVVDFGVAKMGDTLGTALTQHGALLGTPQFMSPEQISSNSNIDGRSDIYSVGCILFYLLTGRHPHEGETILELLQSKLSEIAPRISEVEHTPVPVAVEEVVARCLSANPDDRFSTMLELKQALLRAVQHADPSGLATSAATGVVPSPTQSAVRKFGFVAVVLFSLFLFFATIFAVDRVSQVSSTKIDSTSDQAPPGKRQLNKIEKLQQLFDQDNENPPCWESAAVISDEDLKLLTDQNVMKLRLDAQPELRDSACLYFSKFPNLLFLSIQDAKIGDKGIGLISKCKKLSKLCLGGTEITDSGLAPIADLPLEDLGLERTKVSGAGMKYLAKLKSLTRLEVTLTKFDDQGLKAIVNLPLESLHAESTLITNKGMKSLPGRKTMKRLYAEHTAIGEPGLRAIASYPIDELCLAGCSAVDDHCLDFIARTWPKLSKLTISSPKITGKGIRKIGRLNNLRDLRMPGMQLSDEDVSPIFQIKGLQQLTLKDMPITDKTLERFSELSLRKIDIQGCKQTTPGGRKAMSARCFNLGQSDAKSILQEDDDAVESVTNAPE